MANVAISETSDSESPDSESYAPVGDEFQVNTYTPSDQQNPSTTALSDGGFVITWISEGQDGSVGDVKANGSDVVIIGGSYAY